MKINYESKHKDIRIDGPGSPNSLKKFLHNEGPKLKKINILVDGSGDGIAKDDESCIYITPETRKRQAEYYVTEKFTGQIPAYLYRYMHFLFCKDSPNKYKTDQDVLSVQTSDDEYQRILKLIKYSTQNSEAQQCIGMIQELAGYLNIARKQKKGLRLYIEHPEHALHPGMQSRFTSMLIMLQNEYGFKTEADEDQVHDKE